MKLGKNVFLAIAAVGVADGSASADEVEALAHAARECGIDGADLEEVKQVAKTSKGKFDAIKRLNLTPEERLFAYAVATWLVRIDGVVMPEEKMALMQFGEALRLADGDRTLASAASFKVWQLDPEVRPQKFDIAGLAERIKSDLAAAIPSSAGSAGGGEGST